MCQHKRCDDCLETRLAAIEAENAKLREALWELVKTFDRHHHELYPGMEDKTSTPHNYCYLAHLGFPQ